MQLLPVSVQRGSAEASRQSGQNTSREQDMARAGVLLSQCRCCN